MTQASLLASIVAVKFAVVSFNLQCHAAYSCKAEPPHSPARRETNSAIDHPLFRNAGWRGAMSPAMRTSSGFMVLRVSLNPDAHDLITSIIRSRSLGLHPLNGAPNCSNSPQRMVFESIRLNLHTSPIRPSRYSNRDRYTYPSIVL